MLFRTDRTFRDFDRSSYGGSVTIGRRVWKWLNANMTYRIENVKISDIDSNARLILTSSDRTISSLGVGLKWDSRNNLLDPSKGNLTQTNLEFAGGPFGISTKLYKNLRRPLCCRNFYKAVRNTRRGGPYHLDVYFKLSGQV